MALKQLVLRKKIDALKAQLEAIRAKDPDFEKRREALKTREAELEVAVNEVTEETSAEDKQTLEESVSQHESDEAALTTEEAEQASTKKNIEDQIKDLESQLAEIEDRSKKPAPAAAAQNQTKERKDDHSMPTRAKFDFGLSFEQREALVAREDVKSFLSRVRDNKGQKRAVTGAELAIPDVMLDLLRDNLHRYSKLLKHLRVKNVSGKSRQTIMGAIPEGVWTEAIGKINELALVFNQIEVDGYKVGGYIPVPNSTLEDTSDINLFAEIMDALGQAIGYAVDKAILFGTGTKMPLGIATRLAQASQPSSWGTYAPTWTDLRATHLLKFDPTSMTAVQFFQTLLLDLGVAAPNYASGGTFWAMNRKTHMKLMSQALAFNAAGALVAGVNAQMPIEGGDIVELDFISDNDIIGGFGSLYLLAERAGSSLAVSEHVAFTDDQTVFRGTARYDGMPVYGEAFLMVNIANASPTTTKSFASDEANPQ
jgi:HK97 family phage major capsid protein